MNLSDMSLIVTRPEPAARRFLSEVESSLGRFGKVALSPLIAIRFLEPELALTPDTVFAFTSENGAQAAARLCDPAGFPAWCVGDRTTQAARDLGFVAQSAQGDVDRLVMAILSQPATGPVLHVAGRHQRGNLAASLRAQGRTARSIVAYEQAERPLSGQAQQILSDRAPVALPVFSPRTAQILATALAQATAPLCVVAISAAALAPLGAPRGWSAIAETPDSAGVVRAMGNLIASAGLP